MSENNQWFRINADVIAKSLGDELILVHFKTNRVFSFNHTSKRFWELLAEGYERSEIEQKIKDEFDVDSETLGKEIDSLLAFLRKEDLILPIT